jgi:hypothetical protein
VILRSRSRWICGATLLAFGVSMLNALVGAFPLCPFEGDDQALIIGMRERLRGASGFPELGYTKELHAGVYDLVQAIHSATGADVAQVFFVGNVVAGILFILGAGLLGARLLDLSFPAVLLGVALAQECTTAIAYANTSTYGAAFVLLGVLGVEYLPSALWASALSAAVIAIGGWCRLDALALAPLVLVVLSRKSGLRAAVWRTCTVALASVCFLWALLHFSGVTLGNIWGVFAAKPQTVGWWRTASWLVLIHSATALVVSPVALFWSLRLREYVLVAAFALVTVPLVFIHGRSLDTTKYLYYVAPLLGWSMVWLASRLFGVAEKYPDIRQRLALFAVGAVAMALILEYFTGIRRVHNEARQWVPSTHRVLVPRLSLGATDVMWCVGAGEEIPTGDGFRLRMGVFFAPWEWRQKKLEVMVERRRLERWMTEHTNGTIITSTYYGYQAVVAFARGLNLRPSSRVYSFGSTSQSHWLSWNGAGRSFVLVLINHEDNRRFQFRATAKGAADDVIFVNDMGAAYANDLLRGDDHAWRLLSTSANCGLTLYRRE